MASPFVQGQLRNTDLSVEITTLCAHCEEPIRLAVDSRLKVHVREGGSAPLVFEPDVDWAVFTDPSIIDGY